MGTLAISEAIESELCLPQTFHVHLLCIGKQAWESSVCVCLFFSISLSLLCVVGAQLATFNERCYINIAGCKYAFFVCLCAFGQWICIFAFAMVHGVHGAREQIRQRVKLFSLCLRGMRNRQSFSTSSKWLIQKYSRVVATIWDRVQGAYFGITTRRNTTWVLFFVSLFNEQPTRTVVSYELINAMTLWYGSLMMDETIKRYCEAIWGILKA